MLFYCKIQVSLIRTYTYAWPTWVIKTVLKYEQCKQTMLNYEFWLNLFKPSGNHWAEIFFSQISYLIIVWSTGKSWYLTPDWKFTIAELDRYNVL